MPAIGLEEPVIPPNVGVAIAKTVEAAPIKYIGCPTSKPAVDVHVIPDGLAPEKLVIELPAIDVLLPAIAFEPDNLW